MPEVHFHPYTNSFMETFFPTMWLLIIFGMLQSLTQGVSSSTTFIVVNKCDHTVWPAILSYVGIAPLKPTGFALRKGESHVLIAPSGWSGQFWGRTHCSKHLDGTVTCGSGDCGSGKIECAGAGATPPVTLAEFTLAGHGGMDMFAVSLVDGYNLPMLVSPTRHNCKSTGCMIDLNSECPPELKLTDSDGKVVACNSACRVFGREEYCCGGAYGTRDTCKPSSYSQLFKTACPHAYTYAYDDKTGTFSCSGADYQVTFCPTSKKSREEHSTPQSKGEDSRLFGAFIVVAFVVLGCVGVSWASIQMSRLTISRNSCFTFIFVKLMSCGMAEDTIEKK